MNTKGNAKSLVAAHPGNRNAVKSGVFSPATLAPRVDELKEAIATRSGQEVSVEILRYELAALTALREAMDQSLATDGVRGRRGDPRTLVSLRLRLNEKLRQTMQHYERAVGHESATRGAEQGSSSEAETTASTEARESLVEGIANAHSRPSITAITPRELDPEVFLRCVITTSDPTVKPQDRLRARRMLTRRRKNQPPTCLCFSALKARNEIEFRGWIDDVRGAGVEPNPDDVIIAAVVRRIGGGDRMEPWVAYRRTVGAINDVVTEGADRVNGGGTQKNEPPTGENDPAVKPFWQSVLSPDRRLTVKERLQAFEALDEVGVLPQCTCPPERARELIEYKNDAACAYTIRLVAKKHYRAAIRIAQYPEAYLAVRDLIDARILSELETAPANEKQSAPTS